MILDLHIDIRWLLDRQEELLGKQLTVRDLSGPSIEVGAPDAFWRAAALLEQIVLLRPLPARNEFLAHGVAIAYIRASGETVDASYTPWRT
ncbi:toxin Doc [Streptomyces sp. NPDC029554]|uniref:toxin Doc n=1 Tax=Streptomyces sp. NPDC029554 TaxID=3155126 RepID=UPI0033ECD72B